MKERIPTFSALAVLAACVLLAAVTLNAAGGAAPPSTIPTFPTAEIGRMGHFYVGGHWAGEPGKETMDGAAYVEVWVPKNMRHPYPLVFISGGGGQWTYNMLQTPDGRPGWAWDFVRAGYTVYMMDYPGQGRSAFNPAMDGTIVPPRSGPLMEEIWTGGRPPATPQSTWPQYKKYSQWPSDAPNKGKMGDPVFDYFAKTEQHAAVGPNQEQRNVDAMVALLDAINQPVILLLNSGAGATGWAVADRRSKLVKGILGVEPVAPPIENAERGSTGPGRLYGLSNVSLTYNPPIKDASELRTVKESKADGPDLIPCIVQQEPARKLVNLEGIPVLDVSGEASYHRPYAHCIAKWLNQAGVKTQFVNLEDVGLRGNGHQMMSEKNSAEIAKYLQGWIDKNVH